MNTHAEQHWLSAVLNDRDGGHRIFERAIVAGLTEFAFTGGQAIFGVLLHLYGERVPFSTGLVERELAQRNRTDLLGEGHYLHSLFTKYYTVAAQADYWLAKLIAESHERKFKSAALDIKEIADDDNDANVSVAERVEKATHKLFSVLQATTSANVNIHDAGERIIEQWRIGEQARLGISWPLPKLQQVVGPITDELCIVAAQPSVGKTAFTLQMALHAAWEGKTASFLSLESGGDKIVQRMLAQVTKLPTLPMKHGRVTSGRYDEAISRWKVIKDTKMRLRSGPHTVEQIHAWAHAEKAAGSRMLIIDNLKHIRIRRRFDSLPEQFRYASEQMKAVRDDAQIPLIVVHHLNDKDKMSWSSDIERDFDIILVMAANESASTMPGPGMPGLCIVDFQMQKNRDGAAGFVLQAKFDKDIQTFEPWPADPPRNHVEAD